MNALPPLSLYIHLPWCVKKCPYCDFNSHQRPTQLPEQAYIDALLADLAYESEALSQRPLVSVFVGGGTPSLFSPVAIERLLLGVKNALELATDAEITMEANPGTLEHAPLAAYVDAGITRLSLGVQSFDERALKRIGRIHGGEESRRALAMAQAAGFDSVNVDLMYALPQQTVAEAKDDVASAIATGVDHISHYQLTIEPQTLFHAQPPSLPDEETSWTMQQSCQQLLREGGYHHYEISAYARAGRQCHHNLNYWQFGDYIGIGAGAHGKLTDASGKVTRYWKIKHPQRYLERSATASPLGGRKQVSQADLLFEFALNALRLRQGFAITTLTQRTGLVWDEQARPWADLIEQGLLHQRRGRIACTARGRRYLNEVLERFVPDAPAG